MKYIDIDNWARKEHYRFFRAMDHPHFGLTANVDITRFYRFVKEQRLSFFQAFLYVLTRTANEIPEFRYRIRGEHVIEHEVVHPSFTLMTTEKVFRFCETQFNPDFRTFLDYTAKRMEMDKDTVYVADEAEQDYLIYVTSLPWVSFTGVSHPMHWTPVDSVPRFAWGKYFEENGKMQMPLNVQVHHALADGVHVGEFYMKIQELLDNLSGADLRDSI